MRVLRLLRRLAAILLIAGLLAAPQAARANGDRLVVVDGPLNVRMLPSLTSAVVTTVPLGTVLELKQTGAEWSAVRLPAGHSGWVASRYTAPYKDLPLAIGFRPILDSGSGYMEVGGQCVGPAPIFDGRMYAPVRDGVSRVGGEAVWHGGAASVWYQGSQLRLMPGNPEAQLDGRTFAVEPAPRIVADRMLVPIRTLADAFGLDLKWHGERRTATIGTDRLTAPVSSACNPLVPVRAYVVLDAATGVILAEQRAVEPIPVASTTKIMTALLALERSGLDDKVTVSRRAAATGGSTAGLRRGERLRMRELLYGVMLPSGNDAAVAVAEHLAGSEAAFAQLMNRQAAALGARSTNFHNASGLDDDSTPLSTARDLAFIARHAMQNPEFRSLVSVRDHWMLTSRGSRKLENRNQFIASYAGSTGIKNGWTETAGHTLVASAFRDGGEVIVVVLGAGSRWSLYRYAADLMDLGFRLRGESWVLR